MEIEKESALAAQAHFGLAGLYRKQDKAAEAQHEMREFQRLQDRHQARERYQHLGTGIRCKHRNRHLSEIATSGPLRLLTSKPTLGVKPIPQNGPAM